MHIFTKNIKTVWEPGASSNTFYLNLALRMLKSLKFRAMCTKLSFLCDFSIKVPILTDSSFLDIPTLLFCLHTKTLFLGAKSFSLFPTAQQREFYVYIFYKGNCFIQAGHGP